MLLSLLACTGSDTEKVRIEPSFVVVSVAGDQGSIESPLPFSAQTISRTLTVTTLDTDASPYPFSGELTVKVRPGLLAGPQTITLSDGQWSGDVTFSASFGPTRLWVADEGDEDGARTPSYAAGVSETLYFEKPTIEEMNDIEDIDTNHLDGEFTELRLSDREVVVTVLGTTGFWATDRLSVESADAATPGGFASLFVYTFSAPSDLEVGSRLIQLSGNNQEYLGTTQLSYPTYTAEEGTVLDPPEVPAVDASTLCDDRAMESLESAVIEISGASIPSTFTEDDEDYVDYGQWPAAVGGCSFSVDTSGTTFIPTAGLQLTTLRGLVTQVWSEWVILVTESEDVVGAAARPLTRPAPRHRDGSPATGSAAHAH